MSALSNSAAITGKDEGYLIWGISNKKHKIIWTNIDYSKDIKGNPFQNYLAHRLKVYYLSKNLQFNDNFK